MNHEREEFTDREICERAVQIVNSETNVAVFVLRLEAENKRLQKELETVRGLNDALRANGDELLERWLISEGRLPGGNP